MQSSILCTYTTLYCYYQENHLSIRNRSYSIFIWQVITSFIWYFTRRFVFIIKKKELLILHWHWDKYSYGLNLLAKHQSSVSLSCSILLVFDLVKLFSFSFLLKWANSYRVLHKVLNKTSVKLWIDNSIHDIRLQIWSTGKIKRVTCFIVCLINIHV